MVEAPLAVCVLQYFRKGVHMTAFLCAACEARIAPEVVTRRTSMEEYLARRVERALLSLGCEP